MVGFHYLFFVQAFLAVVPGYVVMFVAAQRLAEIVDERRQWLRLGCVLANSLPRVEMYESSLPKFGSDSIKGMLLLIGRKRSPELGCLNAMTFSAAVSGKVSPDGVKFHNGGVKKLINHKKGGGGNGVQW